MFRAFNKDFPPPSAKARAREERSTNTPGYLASTLLVIRYLPTAFGMWRLGCVGVALSSVAAGVAQRLHKVRKLRESADLSQYTGVRVNTDEAVITMGAGEDVVLYR